MPLGTFYPITSDVTIKNSNAVWATCRDAASGGSIQGIGGTVFATTAWYTADGYYVRRVQQGFLTGDTIPTNSIINSGTLSINCDIHLNNDAVADDDICVYEGTPADITNITVDDFSKFGTALVADRVATYGTGVYIDLPLTAAGLTIIGKGSGNHTKVCYRVGGDVDNNPPAQVNNHVNEFEFYSADIGNTSIEPRLVINYTALNGLDLTSKYW